MKTIIYETIKPWKYYLYNAIADEYWIVTEKEFFEVVGNNRFNIPMRYDKKNINRQNFYVDNIIIGYRERK